MVAIRDLLRNGGMLAGSSAGMATQVKNSISNFNRIHTIILMQILSFKTVV